MTWLGAIAGLFGVALGYLVVIPLIRAWRAERIIVDMTAMICGLRRKRWESNRALRARTRAWMAMQRGGREYLGIKEGAK